MTLIVLVWYAYDTNTIARVTSDRWTREGVLATTYGLAMPGTSVGDVGHTGFQLHNGSPLVVRAKVNFNFKVYGQPVKTHPPRVGAIERGRDALVYEQLGAPAANGPPTDSCFSRLIMVARPFALSLVIP